MSRKKKNVVRFGTSYVKFCEKMCVYLWQKHKLKVDPEPADDCSVVLVRIGESVCELPISMSEDDVYYILDLCAKPVIYYGTTKVKHVTGREQQICLSHPRYRRFPGGGGCISSVSTQSNVRG
jgi:hypothetical protein